MLLPIPNLTGTRHLVPSLGKGLLSASDGMGFIDPTKQPFGAIAHDPALLQSNINDSTTPTGINTTGLATSTV